VLVVCAGLLAGLLVACGGGSSGADAEPTGSTVAQDDSAFPITIDHLLGSTTFEEPAQRIVALGPADQDILLALGIVPIAMVENPYDGSQLFPWVRDAGYDLSGVEFLPWETTLTSVEAIAAMKPDAIIATTAEADPSLYDRYSKMGAPILPPIEGPVADDWRSLTLTIGRVVGREARAAEVVAETEAAIEGVRERLPNLAGRTFVVGSAYEPGTVRVVNKPTDTVAQLFAELGMEIPPQLAAIENPTAVGAADISTERIELLDADALFLAGEGTREGLEGWEPFQRLRSVSSGAYLPYDSQFAYGLRVPTPLSVPFLLAEIEPVLAKIPA